MKSRNVYGYQGVLRYGYWCWFARRVTGGKHGIFETYLGNPSDLLLDVQSVQIEMKYQHTNGRKHSESLVEYTIKTNFIKRKPSMMDELLDHSRRRIREQRHLIISLSRASQYHIARRNDEKYRESIDRKQLFDLSKENFLFIWI